MRVQVSLCSPWSDGTTLGVSRRYLFEAVEQAALASLPAEHYEFAEVNFQIFSCGKA